MTSTTKPTKENKPYSSAPRLLPRPTAASAARAARNATNRNIVSTNSQKGSPTRNPANPVPVRSCHATKSNCRNVQKTDSKSEVKTNPANDTAPAEETVEIEIIKASCDTLAPMEDQYLIPDNVQEDIMEEHPSYPCSVGILEDIKENKILETVSGDERSSEFEDAQNTGQIEVIEKPVSRPQSPMLTSRPQTPKSMPKSRPQTPRTSSRPTTPSPFQVPPSRPNTPQRSVTRPSTPSRPPTPKKCNKENKAPPSNQLAINKEEGDVKTVFIMKQKQFHRMKKELDMKQREILDMFDNLRNLRDRMTREGVSGCGEGHLNELVMFNVADWTSEEIAHLCQAANGKSTTNDALDVINTAVPIDDRALAELDANVSNVPACFADLCLQAFTARQELIDWVKELIENNAIREENDSGECLERIAQYNTQGLRMCDALRELKNKADDVVCTLSQLSRRACRERSALVMVGESLIREIARLQQDTQGGEDSGPEHKVIERVRSELEEEKAASAILKDKLATTETHLRQARGRINKMDRQLREAETSIASLTGTVKTLEDQSRQKEVQLEARARKLKESLKSGEFTSGQLTQQRDALQAEIILLKEQIEAMQSQHKTTTQELTNKIKDLKTALDEQTKLAVKETEDKKSLELALAESKNTIEELNAKIHKLENSLPNPDLPTEREMDLWAQLQATKDTLRLTEDEIASCKKEKIRFLETLTKIAETDNKVGMQQKLAAELLSKEEIMGKMQCQIRELTKNIKLNEQKVLQYEQYVRDLQDHNRAVANCQETPNGISYQDLQHEIMNLKMSLLDQVHRNEELSEILVQKEQHIDQQDKTSRAQARVIKVREELINMLKNKETEQSRELTALQQDLEHRMKVVDEVNKQIASKADEIQELFSTLENKQQQIHRLEKIVLALEEQQRRAQAQRTRHEEKIAALEHELAAGNRRERKFLFF